MQNGDGNKMVEFENMMKWEETRASRKKVSKRQHF